jgi:hypothetical protein
VTRFSSAGGTPQKELLKSTKIASGIASIVASSMSSSRLLLTMAVLRSATVVMETDFLAAPFFLLGSLSS